MRAKRVDHAVGAAVPDFFTWDTEPAQVLAYLETKAVYRTP